MKYSIESPDEIKFTPSVNIGLSFDQVDRRRKQRLTNKNKSACEHSVFLILIKNLFSVSTLLLIVIMVLLAIFDEPLSFLLLVVIVPKIAFGLIKDISTWKVARNNNQYNSGEFKVVRDKKLLTLKSDKLVLDDVILVNENQVLTFDAEVAEGTLLVDDSFITGNNAISKKEAGDMIFSGSTILRGKAYVRVSNVRQFNTQQKTLKQVRSYDKSHSSSYNFVNIVSWVACGLSVFLFVLALIVFSAQKTIVGFESFKAQMTPILELIEVILPCVLYVFVPIYYFVSSLRLRKNSLKVVRSENIETFAKADVICFDKTNTLTGEHFSIKKIVSLGGLNQTDINQVISDILVATKDQSRFAQSLRKSFVYELSRDVNSIIPYSPSHGFFGASFKGGKTCIIGEISKVNLLNKQGLLKRAEEYFADGYEVLVLAEAHTPLVKTNEPLQFVAQAFIVLAEDIPEKSIETIKWLVEQGKEIYILSSDSTNRCEALALRVGFADKYKAAPLNEFTNQSVGAFIGKYYVFSNCSKEQKANLVRALREQGKKVAMIGDGDNDALAMRSANTSLTVSRGSTLAKANADVILPDSDISGLKDLFEESKVVENKLMKIIVTFLMVAVPLFVLGLGFTLVSAFSNISEIRYPLNRNHYLMFELFYVATTAIFLVFENSSAELHGKFAKYTLISSIFLSFIGMLSIVAVPLAFALQVNNVIFTGFPSDAYDHLYTSTNMVTGIFVLFAFVLSLTLWYVDRKRSATLIICRIMQTILLLGFVALGFFTHTDLFGVNFHSIVITAVYIPLVMFFIIGAISVPIYALIHFKEKEEEDENVENQSKD